ncbi:NUDIX domain-containing protein [Amycolatopsis silviterrae]|uniref:NUDIX domain-containing protein n=1 Tax=Amycolatopsis silviterrae TaxID=1656914 RepID=A0ABW5HP24_9PSEU
MNVNEDLPTAVLREFTEETGLTSATVVGALTAEDQPHPETGQPRHTTYFHLLAPDDTSDEWMHRVEETGSDIGMIFVCRLRRFRWPTNRTPGFRGHAAVANWTTADVIHTTLPRPNCRTPWVRPLRTSRRGRHCPSVTRTRPHTVAAERQGSGMTNKPSATTLVG